MLLKNFFENSFEMIGRKLNLVLHAGTPKTGTTSLQFFLKINEELLNKQGYLFTSYSTITYDPKHQWLVNGMLDANEDFIVEHFRTIFLKLNPDTHTIILTAEGIYNHWRDYSNAGKNIIKVIGDFFNLKIILFLREPVSFIESLYLQMLKNPQMELVWCYGRNISLTSMLKNDWFKNQLNYLGFIDDVVDWYGAGSLILFKYEKSLTIQYFCDLFNIKNFIEYNIEENLRLNYFTVMSIRLINLCKLNSKEKLRIVNMSKFLGERFFYFIPKYHCSKLEKEIIIDYFKQQKEVLKEKFKIDFFY